MSTPSVLAHRETAPGRVRWWVVAAAVAFCGYYALLVSTDLNRPEPLGFGAIVDPTGMRVQTVATGSPAARAGLRPGDVVVRAGGRDLRQRLDWTGAAMNIRVGEPLDIEIASEEGTRVAALTARRAPWPYWSTGPGATLLSGRSVQLVALVLALVVAVRRPDDGAARSGAWLLASMAVFSIDWPYQLAARWRDLPLPIGGVLWVPFASSLVLPAILFTFFATFPRPVVFARWVAAAWAPMLALAGVELLFVLRTVYAPAEAWAIFDWTRAHGAALAAYGLGAVAVLTVGYRRLTDVTERRRVRFLMVGSAVGLLSLMPAVSFHWSRPAAMVGDSFFTSPAATLATLLGLALPLAFAHAILRHRLFSVGHLIRAGLQYALARGVLVSVVPATLAIFLADLWLHRDAPFDEVVGARGWGYLALAGVAVLARVRRGQWLETLDRRFFRERYNAEQLLRRIGEEVRAARSVDAVASSVVAKIEAALHPKVTALLVRVPGGEAYRVAAAAPVTVKIGPLAAGSRIARLLQVLQTPLRVVAAGRARLLRELPSGDVTWLEQARADLIVPVCDATGAVVALLVLGPRRSQEPYSAGDEDLLMAIAHSLAARPLTAAPGGGADERVRECPQCGACYDETSRCCTLDDAALAVLPLPRQLAGRYRLDRRIGRGGMGTVYEAFDTALDRRVAVKLLREDVVDAAGGSLERFTIEARVAASLVHPHVVTIHDIGATAEGRPFFVMELVQGETLREVLRRTGPLPPDRVRRLLAGICAAVGAAHRRNIVHRDLKPENVMVCEGDIVKVLDFGLAKPLEVQDGITLTQPYVIIGTPEYMSPEHRRGGDPSPDWDLWAISVMALEMLTGMRPALSRAGASVASTGADTVLATPGPAGLPGDGLPPGLGGFFARTLSSNPIERVESVGELLDAFDAALEERHALRA